MAKFALPDDVSFSSNEGAKFTLPDDVKFELPDDVKFDEGNEYDVPGGDTSFGDYLGKLWGGVQALGQGAVDFASMVPSGVEGIAGTAGALHGGADFNSAMQAGQQAMEQGYGSKAAALTRGAMTDAGQTSYEGLQSAFHAARDVAGRGAQSLATDENQLGAKHIGQFAFDTGLSALPFLRYKRAMGADMSHTARPDAHLIAQENAAKSAMNVKRQVMDAAEKLDTTPKEVVAKATTLPEKNVAPAPIPLKEQSQEVGVYKKGVGGDILDSPFLRLTRNFKGRDEIPLAFRQHEYMEHAAKTEYQPLLNSLKESTWDAMSKPEQRAFKYNWLNERWPQLEKQLTSKLGEAQAKVAVNTIRESFKKRFSDLKKVGIKQNYRAEYAPRVVVDQEAIANLHKDVRLQTKLDELEAKLRKKDISSAEYALAFNKIINHGMRRRVVDPHSAHEKARTVEIVPDKLMDAYADPFEAAGQYFKDTGQVLAQRKFLGKNNSLEGSIGETIAKFKEKHPMTRKQEDVLRDVIQARFAPEAYQPMRGLFADAKNLGYIGSIGQFTSALTQLGDLAAAVGRHGVRDTAVGLGKALTLKKNRKAKGIVDPTKYGMGEPMAELVSQPRKTAKALDSILRATGFKLIDRIGKRTIANAAANKFKRWAKTENKYHRFEKKGYKDLLGEAEFKKFIEDLKTGDLDNPNVTFAYLNEVAEVQPVWMSDMPIAYLTHPQGRILYSLKTWFIRQINRYREDIQHGDYGKALKYATAIYIGTGSVDLGKKVLFSALRGDDIKQSDVKDTAVTTFLQTFTGLNRWELERSQYSKPLQILFSGTAPPIVGMTDKVVGDVSRAVRGKLDPTTAQSVGNVPIVGNAARRLIKE